MKENPPKKHARRFCSKCAIKFERRRLFCPFCRAPVEGSLPAILLFALLGVAALFAVALLAAN